MPNKAMITVTTADSKYSRTTVLGGPVGSVLTFDSRSRPLGLAERGLKTVAFSVVFFSVVIADSFIADIVDAGPRCGQAMPRLLLICVASAPAQPERRQLLPL